MLRAFPKHKKSNMEGDSEKYRQLRNEYQRGLDEAEIKYKESLASTLQVNRNTKRWWQTVKWLLGKDGDRSYPALKVDNKQITMNKDKAEALKRNSRTL